MIMDVYVFEEVCCGPAWRLWTVFEWLLSIQWYDFKNQISLMKVTFLVNHVDQDLLCY